MCFATLEDYTEQLEVTVFPRTFYQHVNLLMPDMAVVIQGKVDVTDDGVKVLADRIWPLAEYLPEYYLMLPVGNDAAEKEMGLKAIMAAHPGTHVVYIHQSRWQKLGPECGLDGEEETLMALQDLLGREAVKKR